MCGWFGFGEFLVEFSTVRAFRMQEEHARVFEHVIITFGKPEILNHLTWRANKGYVAAAGLFWAGFPQERA